MARRSVGGGHTIGLNGLAIRWQGEKEKDRNRAGEENGDYANLDCDDEKIYIIQPVAIKILARSHK